MKNLIDLLLQCDNLDERFKKILRKSEKTFEKWKLQEEHRIKLAIRGYEKEIKKTKERLEFYKGDDKYENYLNNILKNLISGLERAKAWKV